MKKITIQIRVTEEDKKLYLDKAWERRMRLSQLMRELWEAGWNLKYGNPKEAASPSKEVDGTTDRT